MDMACPSALRYIKMIAEAAKTFRIRRQCAARRSEMEHARSVHLQTTSPAMSRLNDVALVFEIEIDPDGTVHDNMWGWE
jgi:hypothetical protein